MAADYTRVVSLREDIDRHVAGNVGTYCPKDPNWREALLPLDPRSLFNRQEQRMHEIARGYSRPGVVIFAVHTSYGMRGHLWLEATAQLRAGSIGRHSNVDLHLPDDDELSLRHLLVLVDGYAGVPRVHVLDLATPNGFMAENDKVVRGLMANGFFVFSAAQILFFAVPTGVPPPWDGESGNPWSTLPPRKMTRAVRPKHPPRRRRQVSTRKPVTRVSVIDGPIDSESGVPRAPGEPVVGCLTLTDEDREEDLLLGDSALKRGVVLGRYDRCAGHAAAGYNVSRVHAVLAEVYGRVHLIDAGSTNGIVVEENQVKCAPIVEEQTYSLGSMRLTWERGH